jgi:AAA domain
VFTLSPTGSFRSSRTGAYLCPAPVPAAPLRWPTRPAHSATGPELIELLSHEGLAGLEFVNHDSLKLWYTEVDLDPAGLVRRDAWRARQANAELRVRGLARVMSSDAHDASLLGKDGTNRPLAKLRLDDLNFGAVKNALLHNPKGRTKAEALLPVVYPRVLSASFRGGFLDGVEFEFSSNLNCLIGGRGSGKSTALLAIRTALGAPPAAGEDPDAPGRMPDATIVRFIDGAGSERIAIRDRGGAPYDEDGDPVRLALADLAQDESGAVARDYVENPSRLLDFLDAFCSTQRAEERERDLLDRLRENGEELKRTSFRDADLEKLVAEQAQLDAQFKAAEGGRLEELADWARRLATQAALIARLRDRVTNLLAPRRPVRLPTLA